MLGKLFKGFLVGLVILLVILMVFGVVLTMGWPWWVGLFVLAGLVAIVLCIVFVRNILARKKEQEFVTEIVEQDEAYARELDAKERERHQDLQERWKEAIRALKNSQLAKRGNPLYVLPWYLVIGESGSGKTTAIESARLTSPFGEVARTAGISGTRNCDWWFFEQAILLDTAGRYAIPVDEGRDKEEWRKFLALLVKYRKKEPINGVVVTLAADKILQAEPEQLQQDGVNIRRRLDELMRALGVKFPVYLLITKCDLIQGMTQFCELLPEKKLQEAMGVVNEDLQKDALAFANQAMDTVGDRLRNHRLLALHEARKEQIGPSLLVFPEEFEKLRPGLSAFIRTAFKENPYQETPLLRGVYFSSGRQEGTPYSHFLRELGLIEERDILPGTNRGLFLHDFFASVLPKDRSLFAPTRYALHWRRLTRNIGLAAWVTFVLAVCGLMSFSFIKNLQALRSVSHEFTAPVQATGDLTRDVALLRRFQKAVTSLEKANRGWWVPRFHLNHSLEAERTLKQRFWKQFYESLLAPYDRDLAQTIGNISQDIPDIQIAEYASLLIRRIKLLESRLTGADADELRRKLQPDFRTLIGSFPETESGESLTEQYGELYLHSLLWRPQPQALSEEYRKLQSMLSTLITRAGRLHWLVSWANQQEDLQEIRVTDFWKGTGDSTDFRMVSKAYTKKGYQTIDGFLKELKDAIADPSILKKREPSFRRWYEEQYLEAWRAFLEDATRGPQLLKGRKEWHAVASVVDTDEGPYFAVLDRAEEELTPVIQVQKNPAWLIQIFRYEWIKSRAARSELTSDKKGILSKAAEKGKRLLSGLQGRAERLARYLPKIDPQDLEHYKAYRKSLLELGKVADSRKAAFAVMTKTFSSDPTAPEGPYFETMNHLEQWVDILGPSEDRKESPVPRLLEGPADFLFEYARRETACVLQTKWEEEVLGEIQGLPPQRAVEKLLVKGEGLAWKFVRGTAAPFLHFRIKKNYTPKKVLGKSIAFQNDFFSFINRGTVARNIIEEAKSEYQVEIKAYPTDSNRDALRKPHATRVVLHCDDGAQKLVNLQYPVKKVFRWSAETCSDVLFQIEVGDLVLSRKYSGPEAFPRFLRDFSRGRRVFRPKDFPRQKRRLQALGIREIVVRYRFSGHRPVIALLGRTPRRIPRQIATCWD